MRSWGPLAAATAITVGLLGAMQSPVAARDSGVPFVVDGPVAAPANFARGMAPAAITPTYPYANTFKLHSHRGSKHTIFLDFKPVTVSAGSWSVIQLGMTAKTYGGFNVAGSAATFTNTELNFIQQVYRRVAELYAPFDVDVTTEDQGSGVYTRTSAGDDTYGIHVAFTNDPAPATVGCGDPSSKCSGVAPMGTFDNVEASANELQPAWVFTSNTYPDLAYPNSSSLTADSAAHEIGHTFGLSHDGVDTIAVDNYYGGHGNWFPIMGSNQGSTAIAQWSKGEYSHANNNEDDLDKINGAGAPFRTDDYGTAPGAPTNLGKKTSYSVAGVIERDSDNDYFTFNRGCAGPMIVKATGIGNGAAVDLKLTVFNSAGTAIATNDPGSSQTQVYPDIWFRATGLDTSASFAKAANGLYAVRVEGVGHGNPATSGYSGYGSIGQYTLTVSSCTTPLPTAKKPTAPIIGTASSGKAGKPINAIARWSAPKSNGGAAITKYKLQAVKLSATGKVLVVYTYSNLSPGLRSLTTTLSAGRYKFRLVAVNRVGTSPYSAYSKIVLSR